MINNYFKFVFVTKHNLQSNFFKKFSLVFLILAIPYILATSAFAAESLADDQAGRIRTGLKMFRSILLADRDITRKSNSRNETDIIFLYHSNASRAKHLARTFVRMGRMQSKGKIKESQIKVHLMRKLRSIEEAKIKPAAIFLIDPLIESKVKAVVQYGIEQQIVTFSPYEGDVENGILSGLIVDSRIHPFINKKTLAESNVRIKPFFLKVAQVYEPNNVK